MAVADLHQTTTGGTGWMICPMFMTTFEPTPCAAGLSLYSLSVMSMMSLMSLVITFNSATSQLSMGILSAPQITPPPSLLTHTHYDYYLSTTECKQIICGHFKNSESFWETFQK